MLTWVRRPTSVIGGKADMVRACRLSLMTLFGHCRGRRPGLTEPLVEPPIRPRHNQPLCLSGARNGKHLLEVLGFYLLQPRRYELGEVAASWARRLPASTRNSLAARRRRVQCKELAPHLPRPRRLHRWPQPQRPNARRSNASARRRLVVLCSPASAKSPYVTERKFASAYVELRPDDDGGESIVTAIFLPSHHDLLEAGTEAGYDP